MSDSITTEIIRHGLLAAAAEMARNLCRTSYNTVVYEIHDYGLGIHDEFGDVVADAPGIAVFTRGNDHGIKKAVEFLGASDMKPGNVYILNYPYWSSAHTLDPLVFAPIHVGDELIGYASCRVHVLDLKAKNPGYVLDSTSMYEEGLFFPAAKLYQGGEICSDIFNVIRFNSRMPERTIGDIQAQVSACVTGVRRTQELAEKHGVEMVRRAMVDINDHGERLALAALKELPKGTWTAHDFVDYDGVDLDRMIKLNCTVTVTDEEMIIDWSGSDTEVRGPINSPFGLTEAASSLVFKAITTPDTPVVAGNFRPLRVIAEEGSVMNAQPPQPTFTLWTGLLSPEVVLKALAQGMPDRVPACSGGDVCDVMGLGVNPRTGDDWLEATNEAVGFGATAHHDGEDGIMHLSEPGCRNNPVEVLEVKAPLLIEHYGYRPDTGGPGKNRGGVGIGRTYRFNEDSIAIVINYKTKTKPWAIAGGGEGENNHVILHPDTDREEVKGGSYNYLNAGEVLVNNTGGGGGYGNPFERDPAAVARDVRNGFVSAERARIDYGVDVDPDSFEIDEQETARLRSS